MVYIFLAEGFEEIEALAQIDLLRRAGIDVQSVGVSGKNVKGAHGIEVLCDKTFEGDFSDGDMYILPGGMPGVENLYKSDKLKEIICDADRNGKYIAAICAAPIILGRLGLLKGKMSTCYPGFEDELTDAQHFDIPVVVSGNIITSKAAGTAIDFAAELIEVLKDAESADAVLDGIYYE